MAKKDDNLFKKVLYAGVGLASVTAEKIEETVDDLVGRWKISDSEGKKIVEDFFKNTEVKAAEFEGKLKEVVKNVVAKFDFLKREDVAGLRRRVEELEAELAKTKEGKTTSKARATAMN